MNVDKNWQKNYPINKEVIESDLDDNSSLKKILELVGEGKKVVDFGCATGYLSSLLKQNGCIVTGVEINVEAAKISESYCQKVFVADLDFSSVNEILGDQKFDVAIFGDVLEHLRNPQKVLEETRKVLKADGFVVASIPNIAHASIRLSLLQGRFDYTDLGILDNTHLKFFTRKTVSELFKKSGYLASIIDSTKLDPFSTSNLIPQNNEDDFSIELLNKIREDADHDTLQFITIAHPCLHIQLHQSQSEIRKQQIRTQLIKSELEQAQSHIQHLHNIIRTMEDSKFWKSRNIWIEFKKYLGISNSKDNKSLTSITNMMLGRFYNKLFLRSIKNRLQGKGSYSKWLLKNEITDNDTLLIKEEIKLFKNHPKFSIIIPVYNVDNQWLQKAIQSVMDQLYTNWEICIADDASTNHYIRETLDKYSNLDPRIKVIYLHENQNISAASNSALRLATGDYIALLDHDDEMSADALFENAKLINRYPDADFIYSDEDKIDERGNRCDPFFKPDWSPDYFNSCMYTCHLGVYRTGLIRDIGGFRSEYDGAQDYDLVLRVVEKTKQIYHIPKILYHWRIIPSSVTSGEQAKPWAYVAARKALEDMVARSSYPGCVEKTERAGFWRVRRKIIGQPLVSIIIPSAGKMNESGLSHLEKCVSSIQKLTTYSNFEIIIVDGFDINEGILHNLSAPNLKVFHCNEPFNFSMRINKGALVARGEHLLLLNDDTEVVSPDWIESMIELSQQSEIGAVGAKLLFPSGRLQHAGVMILGGNPCHAFHNSQGDHPGYFCSSIVNKNYLAVTGACLMLNHLIFKEIGGMDEDFPFNYNDVDLCLKLHQLGYRNVYTPYAQLIHYESASREGIVKQEEIDRINHKWQPYLKIFNGDPYYNYNLSNNSPNFEINI